jgi:hypothetical protein
MLTDYFIKLSKEFHLTNNKSEMDIDYVKATLSKLISSDLMIDAVKPINSIGFSPDGADLTIYKEYSNDISGIMAGYIPQELLFGTIHLAKKISRAEISQLMTKISATKKLSTFSDMSPEDLPGTDENLNIIPAFLIVESSDNYPLLDLKNDLINYYTAKNIQHEYEVDIIFIMNKGLIIKNWREQRSYVGIETKEDSLMWFYILLNEYLDVDKKIELDFRKYIKKDMQYNQF